MRPVPQDLTLREAVKYFETLGWKRGYGLYKTREELFEALDAARKIFGDLACDRSSVEDSHGSAHFKLCTVIHEPGVGLRSRHFSNQSTLGLVLSRNTIHALTDRDTARSLVLDLGDLVPQE